MVYTFRIVSDEVDDFVREINIDADAKFLDLRNAICEACNWADRNQMHSFFLTDENWEKGQEITLVDMGSDGHDDISLMDETTISDLVEDEGQRLIFVFDYLTDRALFMELKASRPGVYLEAPEVTRSKGEAPAQTIDFNEFEAKLDANAAKAATDELDLDEDFYGSDDYNDDEFNFENFDDEQL